MSKKDKEKIAANNKKTIANKEKMIVIIENLDTLYLLSRIKIKKYFYMTILCSLHQLFKVNIQI